MADMTDNSQDEKPLNALDERLRKKLLRTMVISVGTMFIGIFAVLFAIVYKMNATDNNAQMIDASVTLPVGFVIEESSVDDGTLMLRGTDAKEERSILLFDVVTGDALGQIILK